MVVDESVLINRAQNGDKEAFSQLVVKYYGRIMGYILGLVQNRETALDYTQEVFFKAYRSLKSFKGNSSFYTWLYRIASNYCIDQFRKKRIKVEDSSLYRDELKQKEDENPDFIFKSSDFKDPLSTLSGKELQELIFKVIESLPPKQREVLILREIDGFTYEEIAEAVGTSLGTVMSRLFHARKKAQKILRKYLEGGNFYEKV